MESQGLIGGLCGALITLLITRLLDFYSKKLDHEYLIKKTLFENKVKTAEAIAARTYAAASNYGALATLFDQMAKDKLVGGDVFKILNEKLPEYTKNIVEISADAAHAAHLYFDADQLPSVDNDLIKRLIDNSTALLFLEIKRKVETSLLENSKGTAIESEIQQNLNRILSQYKKVYADLADILREVHKTNIHALKQLRMQFKKYE